MNKLKFLFSTQLKIFIKHTKINIIITLSIAVGLLFVCVQLSYVRTAAPQLQTFFSDKLTNRFNCNFYAPKMTDDETENFKAEINKINADSYAFAYPVYDKSAALESGEKPVVTMEFVSENYFELSHYNLIGGSFPTAEQIRNSEKICAVSDCFFHDYNVKIGDKITVFAEEFTVAAVVQSFGGGYNIFVPEGFFLPGKIVQHTLLLHFSDPPKEEKITETLLSVVPGIENDPRTFTVKNSVQWGKSYYNFAVNTILQMMLNAGLLVIFSFLNITIMAFGNLWLRREIYGVQITLGAGRLAVFSGTLLEYVIYSAAAVIILIPTAPIFEPFVPANMGNIYPTFDWWVFVMTFIAGVVVSIPLSLVLTRKICSYQPVSLMKGGA